MKIKSAKMLLIAAMGALLILTSGCVPENEAEKHYDNAISFMELQMFKEAVIELKNGLRISEKNDTFANSTEKGLLEAAVLMFDAKNDEAIQILQGTIEDHKNYWEAYFLLASVYMQEKNYKKAVETLEKIPSTALNYGQVNFMRGLMYFEKQKYEQSIRELILARDQFQQKILKFREESGSQQFIKNGANLMVSYLLAKAYEEEGMLKESLENYKQVEDINPQFPGIRNNLAIIFCKMGLKNDPQNASTYNLLGWEYLKLKQYSKAVEALKRAISLNPKIASAYNNLGLAYYETKNLTEAITYFKKAISLNNDEKIKMLALYNLGRSIKENGGSGDATNYFEEALKIDPSYEPAKKEFKITLLLQMIRKTPKEQNLYLDLGNNYLENGEIDDAAAAYQKAGANATAYYNLGSIYLEKRKEDKAIFEFKKALKMDPKYWQAMKMLGVALETQGKLDEAAQTFKKALKIKGQENNYDIRNDLAYVYFKIGDIQSAIKEFKGLLKSEKYKSRAEKILGVIG